MQDAFDNESYLKRQRELYLEKNSYLDAHYERVSPFDFYREVFPEGCLERKGHFEDKKSNAIGLEINFKGRARRIIVTDELSELDELTNKEFAIMSPVSYFGRSREGKNARYLFALTFDLDGVDMPQLRDTLHQMNNGFLPAATFVVNSGNGLHLYYVFKEPIPLHRKNPVFLRELKYALTRRIWNRYTSKLREPQVQGIFQGFRVVGSGTKLGADHPVVAYRYAHPTSAGYLIEFIPESGGDRQRIIDILEQNRLSREEAREMYPDWYERRVVSNEKPGRWHIKRALYDWWLDKIKREIHVGHRFYGIMTLAIYAMKCSISEDELRRDAYSLLKPFDDMSVESKNRFTEDDVVSALEMYNESYITFPRDDIAKYSGIPLPPNKRNLRSQRDHLKYMNVQREFKVRMGECTNGGRPSNEQAIRDYMVANPTVDKQVDIAAALQISRNTVGRYYKKIRYEIDNSLIPEPTVAEVVSENGELFLRRAPSEDGSDNKIDSLLK